MIDPSWQEGRHKEACEVRLKEIQRLAKIYCWEEVEWQENISMLSFVKQGARINVYVTRMTVATCINHPQKGRTQLFRKQVDVNLMAKIFRNPRVHTKRGYQKK